MLFGIIIGITMTAAAQIIDDNNARKAFATWRKENEDKLNG
jgi:hypothetical protein